MFGNFSSFQFHFGDQDLTWNTDQSFSQNFIEPDNMEGVLHFHRNVYSYDFVSFNMINPFHDLDLPMQAVLTLVLRLSLILLYVYWPTSSNPESWQPICWRERREISSPAPTERPAYECFDCTFTCTTRDDMNLHARLCVLGVNNLNMASAHQPGSLSDYLT